MDFSAYQIFLFDSMGYESEMLDYVSELTMRNASRKRKARSMMSNHGQR